MRYAYRGPNPCPVCHGERGNCRKGYHWTRPADKSTPWWPSTPCNHCGGTGKAGPGYITLEEYVERNRTRLAKARKKLDGEAARLDALLKRGGGE